MGSFFYGYIVTQIPGGWLATKYGGKRVFLVGISATAILTLLTPVLTKAGTGYLITTRILEGLFEVRLAMYLLLLIVLYALFYDFFLPRDVSRE